MHVSRFQFLSAVLTFCVMLWRPNSKDDHLLLHFVESMELASLLTLQRCLFSYTCFVFDKSKQIVQSVQSDECCLCLGIYGCSAVYEESKLVYSTALEIVLPVLRFLLSLLFHHADRYLQHSHNILTIPSSFLLMLWGPQQLQVQDIQSVECPKIKVLLSLQNNTP